MLDGDLIDRTSHAHVVLLKHRGVSDRSLRIPCAGWPGVLVIPPELIVHCHPVVPPLIPSVLPALMGIDRIIAVATRLIGIGRIVAALLIVTTIVVAKIVVAIARTEKQVFSKDRQVDQDCWSIIVSRTGIDSGIKMNRSK